jgi:ATP adenylyltransferase
MGEQSHSTERKTNLWAPWRMEYIDGLGGDQPDGCFLCRYRDQIDRDGANLVLWRGRKSLAVMNRFPYTGGHSMVAPTAHVASLDELEPAAMVEMLEMVRDLQKVLARAIRAEGFNIGMNVGRCAGAGLPGHLHIHVVPRWGGDTNFMAVLGEVRVIPQRLEELYELLRRAGQDLKLPNLST